MAQLRGLDGVLAGTRRNANVMRLPPESGEPRIARKLRRPAKRRHPWGR